MRPAIALLVALTVAGCAGGSSGGAPDEATGPVRLVKVAGGFDLPVAAEFVPGHAQVMYVVEKTGRILPVRDGTVAGPVMLDLRGRVALANEQGLLGLAFHPRYPADNRIFVNYTNLDGDSRVVSYQVVDGRAVPASARTLIALAQPAANHNGGDLEFGPDGLLYIGFGDGGGDGAIAQDRGSLLGKMLRLDVDTPGAEPQIYAVGLRNPWRYSFDRRTGELWIGDVGQSSWEEVDRLPADAPPGANFGWSRYEGRDGYDQDVAIADPSRLVEPVHQYDHSRGCSITGGYRYRGNGVPQLDGRYLFADFCAGRLMALDPANGRAASLPVPAVEALSAFGEDPAGELYVVSMAGPVYRIVTGS
jgi:glucose/arabinose dehydrogenase